MKSVLVPGSSLYKASLADTKVPAEPGLYEIHIGEPKDLPSPFRNVLSERNQTLLYIGKAEGEDGIRQRLFWQDLRGKKGPATFFRSIGVVLGHGDKVKTPKSVSSIRNFTFENSEEIVHWIEHNLRVGWQLQDKKSIKGNEKVLIKKHGPILNLANSPDTDSNHYRELKNLRSECRDLARERYVG